jgi:hypothetical protein
MEEITMTQNTDASLALCESICNKTYKVSTEALCDRIVEEVEDRARWEEFHTTHLGRLITSGVKVRFEAKTFHEGHAPH